MSRTQLKRRLEALEKILIRHDVIFRIGDDKALEGLETKEGDVIVLLQI